MLKVIKPGFYSTIQDKGRFGYREYGVPVSGAMDLYSSQFANALLGNNLNEAVIEMTMMGGTFQFLQPTLVAVSGADMSPKLNNYEIKQNNVIKIETHDKLTFGKVTTGFRTYLAVRGGFQSNPILGSRSQYKPITKTNIINKDEIINFNSYDLDYIKSKAVVKYNDSVLKGQTLEAYKGPEFNQLNHDQIKLFLGQELKVSKLNNRMAYQLEPLIKNSLRSVITSPVLPGTVQLTPQGNLMVLMRDCQTTGGYPRVLQLTENTLNILSQKSTGNSLKIRLKE